MGHYDRYRDDERYNNPYKDYDWDDEGFPGEFVYGDECYVDPYYGEERWKLVEDLPNYWVSNMGRMYSTIRKKFIDGSQTGRCGHMDLSLRDEDRRRCHRYIHRLTAEAFIPNPNNLPLVRHLDNDPLNNEIENLAWGTQLNNVHDCMDSNRFRHFTDEDREVAMQKRRTPVTAVNLKTGKETDYISQQEASDALNISQSAISCVLRGMHTNAGGYYFYYTNNPKSIDVEKYKYSRHGAMIKAIDLHSGKVYVFKGQAKAAEELGVSIASISNILSGKLYQAKGYAFEYIDEEVFDE